jgi:hypothetical protein
MGGGGNCEKHGGFGKKPTDPRAPSSMHLSFSVNLGRKGEIKDRNSTIG